MFVPINSITGKPFTFVMLWALASGLSCSQTARAEGPRILTVMTRNVDAGTDLNYILGATDQGSFATGMAATIAEVKASGIPERAARLAEEIAAPPPSSVPRHRSRTWVAVQTRPMPLDDVRRAIEPLIAPDRDVPIYPILTS